MKLLLLLQHRKLVEPIHGPKLLLLWHESISVFDVGVHNLLIRVYYLVDQVVKESSTCWTKRVIRSVVGFLGFSDHGHGNSRLLKGLLEFIVRDGLATALRDFVKHVLDFLLGDVLVDFLKNGFKLLDVHCGAFAHSYLLEVALQIDAVFFDLLADIVHERLVLILELLALLLFLDEVSLEDIVPQELVPAEPLRLVF